MFPMQGKTLQFPEWLLFLGLEPNCELWMVERSPVPTFKDMPYAYIPTFCGTLVRHDMSLFPKIRDSITAAQPTLESGDGFSPWIFDNCLPVSPHASLSIICILSSPLSTIN